MEKNRKSYAPKMDADTYYVWVGGSCDYAHETRDSGGAYIMQYGNAVIGAYSIAEDHTTEFRMILTVMLKAMSEIPESSNIVFMTNVQYIQQNFDREPDGKSANVIGHRIIDAAR